MDFRIDIDVHRELHRARGEMDARRVDFNRNIRSDCCCGAQLSVIVVCPPARVFVESTAHSLICFPRFTFDPFFFRALDVFRWADTCILVSSLRRSTFAKGIYLKLTFRESRALFGAPFFLVPAFSVRSRGITSSLSLFLPLLFPLAT